PEHHAWKSSPDDTGGKSSKARNTHTRTSPAGRPTTRPANDNRDPAANRRTENGTPRMDWTTWWLWRGARTRSLPELGRENPQRPWYCVSRHGRVGRRQVFRSIHSSRHPTVGNETTEP